MQRENENCQSGLTLPVGSIVHYVSQEILAIIQTNVPLVRANLLGHSQSRPTIISVNAVKPSVLRYSLLFKEDYKLDGKKADTIRSRYSVYAFKENGDDR